jgi:hypothetical protein
MDINRNNNYSGSRGNSLGNRSGNSGSRAGSLNKPSPVRPAYVPNYMRAKGSNGRAGSGSQDRSGSTNARKDRHLPANYKPPGGLTRGAAGTETRTGIN